LRSINLNVTTLESENLIFFTGSTEGLLSFFTGFFLFTSQNLTVLEEEFEVITLSLARIQLVVFSNLFLHHGMHKK
jgi:hypothetical protein